MQMVLWLAALGESVPLLLHILRRVTDQDPCFAIVYRIGNTRQEQEQQEKFRTRMGCVRIIRDHSSCSLLYTHLATRAVIYISQVAFQRDLKHQLNIDGTLVDLRAEEVLTVPAAFFVRHKTYFQ